MSTGHKASGPTWLGSQRPLARMVGRPVARFLAVETSGGILMVVATIAALIWANSPWSESYTTLWGTEMSIEAGSFHLSMHLSHWVNDALMALFFFVVGLEIKRELVSGQLSDIRDATLPIIAALGGMVVPAAIFAVMNLGGDGMHGWGVPMATDIAFAVGVLTLLGDRVPSPLKVFLLGLAIADDIGAIIVIAIFYTEDLAFDWLGAAALGLVVVTVMRRAKVWYAPLYVVVGVVVWYCTLKSGIHATIAGVALGLLTPARPLMPQVQADAIADRLSSDHDVTAEEVHELELELRASVSVAERLENALHPWTSYLVIPIFALANAGIPLSADSIGDAVSSRVTLGVVLGLVVGKLVGISGITWLAVRLGIGRLPVGVGWRHVVGMASVAGIGFTVAIFVAGLAYDDLVLQDEAKIGVLAASLIAALLGPAILLLGSKPTEPAPADTADTL
ncbi:MAG TPA: Na+/H+ antiporter NhaA [Acidimicrobiales bacterium]